MVVNDALTMIGAAMPRSPSTPPRTGPSFAESRARAPPADGSQGRRPGRNHIAGGSFDQKIHTICVFAPSFPQNLPKTRP